MTLYGAYITNNIDERVDAINHLHKNLSRHKKILRGREHNLYKDNNLGKGTGYMVLNSLLFLHDLLMKYVNAYEGLIRTLYIYIDVIHLLFH